MLERLAGKVVARPRLFVAAWCAVGVVAAVLATGLAGQLANRGFVARGSDSDLAARILGHQIPARKGSEALVVVTARNPAGGYAVTKRTRSATVREVLPALRNLPDVIAVTRLVARTYRLEPHKPAMESVLAIAVRFDLSLALAEKRLPDIRAAVAPISKRDVAVSVVGGLAVSERYSAIARQDLTRAERMTFPLTFAVLLVAFMSVVAAVLPLLLAAVTLMTTLALLWVLSTHVGLSIFVTNTASVLALGLSIDFALFMVTRFREEQRKVRSVDVAITRTMATTGRAIVLSGATIAVTLLSLFAVGPGLFSSMAIGGMLATMVAVLAAITLLPAIICLLGSRLDRFALRSVTGAARRARLWHALANGIAAYPVAAFIASLVVLIGLAIPALSLRVDFHTVSALPLHDPARQEVRHLARVFGPGATGGVSIVTRRDPSAVASIVRKDPNIWSVWRQVRGNDGWAAMQAVLKTPPDGAAAGATIRRLRARLGDSGPPTYLGGPSAAGIDLTDRVTARTPLVIALAIALGLLLLMCGLRSIVIPIKALLSTLLSVGATVGILVLLFPSDVGSPSLEFFVPLFLFAMVFGLSIDYEVFLLSRIREAMLEGWSTTESVKLGLIRSGRSITLAGFALATVFVAFATSPLDAFRQLGVGVAIAVILDVTVVRCVLVPAGAIVLGRWNWWFPSWGGRQGAMSTDQLVPPDRLVPDRTD